MIQLLIGRYTFEILFWFVLIASVNSRSSAFITIFLMKQLKSC